MFLISAKTRQKIYSRQVHNCPRLMCVCLKYGEEYGRDRVNSFDAVPLEGK